MKDACQKFGVKGYPTLIFINEDLRADFSGNRGLVPMKDFALDLVSKPSFTPINTDDSKMMIKTSQAMLLFTYDGANSADKLNLDIILSVSKSIKGKIPVYISPHSQKATLAIHRDNGIDSDVYEGNFENTPANKDKIKSWVLANRFPLVPQLDETTQKDLTESTHLLLAILDPKHKGDQSKLADMVMIAQEWKKVYAGSSVKFAYLDGVQFSSYAKSVYGIDAKDFPRFFVTLPKEDCFYDVHGDGKIYEFTKESVFRGLQDVIKGKGTVLDILTQPKSTKGKVGWAVLRSKRGFQWIWVQDSLI